MDLPGVTVIIPTYNRCSDLLEALDSVCRQTHPDIEVIVINDASQDNTIDCVQQAFPAVNLVNLEHNVGAAAARNIGIQISSKRYLAFLDDDDRWPEDYLQAHVRALEAYPEADLSFCDYDLLEENGEITKPDLRPTEDYDDPLEHLLTEFFIHSMSLVVTRQNRQEKVFLHEPYRIAHDYDFYFRLLLAGGRSIIYLPDCVVQRQRRPGSLVSHLDQVEQEEMDCLERLLPAALPPDRQRRARVYRQLFFAASRLASPSGFWTGMKSLLQSFLTSPFWFAQIVLCKLKFRLIRPRGVPEFRTFVVHRPDGGPTGRS